MIRMFFVAILVCGWTGGMVVAWDNSDYWSYASYQKNVYNWPTRAEANVKYVDLGDGAELVIAHDYNGALFVNNNTNRQPVQAPRNVDWDERLAQFEYR